MNNFLQICLRLLLLSGASISLEIDNGLMGEPEVECAASTVEIQFRTQKAFKGKVFVKGHYSDPNCRVDYSKSIDDKPSAGLVLQHGACDMQRQRMLQPQGLQFSAVIIVSFHPLFITKIDRAFHVKCMYKETSQTVTSQMEVSMIASTQLSESFPMPVCTYTIRKDEIDGEVLRYARVGDQVVHRWECQSEVYGILVHSCVVEDGQGEKMILIDEKGCHSDRYLLGDPTYTESLSMAYRESHVFKFADRVAVRFMCQIKLCLKENGGCNSVTPPICGTVSSARSERLTETTRTDTETSTDNSNTQSTSSSSNGSLSRSKRTVHVEDSTGFVPIDGDFRSQFIYVLDSVEDPEAAAAKASSQYERVLVRSRGAIVSDMRDAVCLSSATFGVLLGAVCIVMCALTAAAIVMLCSKCTFTTQHSDKRVDLCTALRWS